MVSIAHSKIARVGPRHTLYLPKGLVEDSVFPFEVGETLEIEIKGRTVIIRSIVRRSDSEKSPPHKEKSEPSRGSRSE